MIRDLLSQIDTGVLGQVGLIAFVVAFVAVLIYTFTMKRETRDAAKNLPLNDADPANDLSSHHAS